MEDTMNAIRAVFLIPEPAVEPLRLFIGYAMLIILGVAILAIGIDMCRR